MTTPAPAVTDHDDFLFEGGGARESVLATLDEPVMSTALAPGFRSSTARSIGRTRRVHGSVELPPTVRPLCLTR
jgi:hypothetical protein